MKNWAGNQTYRASRVLRPRTAAELRDAVAGSARIRALGTRHSFNELADTEGDQVSLEAMPRTIAIDGDAGVAVVAAGLRYGDIAGRLQRSGVALANLASLPHISIAGAVATSTHGSGETVGSLATAVRGLELVRADGSLVTVGELAPGPGGASASELPLEASVVSLGLLGVVTRLALRVEPTFRVRQQVIDGVPFDATLEAFDVVAGAAYSVSLFTDWHAPSFQVWLKHRVDGEGGGPLPRTFLGIQPAREPRHPVPGVDPSACTVQGGVAGPWHLRLPHFRMGFTPSAGDELQSEYFVPREHAADALRALEPLRARIAPSLFISEVRFVAADGLWLSPAYRRPSTAIHFTWRPDWPTVRGLLPEIEAALAPFEPRPHWGKLSTLDRPSLRSRYERLDAFAALAREHDPTGKFRNDLTDRLVFGD